MEENQEGHSPKEIDMDSKIITFDMTAAEAETLHRLAIQCFGVAFHSECHDDADLRTIHEYACAAYGAQRGEHDRVKTFLKKNPRLSYSESLTHPRRPTTARVLARDHHLTAVAMVLFGLVTAGSGYDEDDFMTGLKVWNRVPYDSLCVSGTGIAKCVSDLKVRIVKEVKG